ncbi:hypothetical protein ACOMHN_039612 [Nucella lapillus]
MADGRDQSDTCRRPVSPAVGARGVNLIIHFRPVINGDKTPEGPCPPELAWVPLENQQSRRYSQGTTGPRHCGPQTKPELHAAQCREGRKCDAPEGASPCHVMPGDRRR